MGRACWTMRTERSGNGPDSGVKSGLRRDFAIPFAAAAVTAVILWAVLYLGEFTPFGVNTPAVTDAKLQYLDLFAYCRDVLTGQNTAQYTFSNMLGGSAVAIWAYYLASPFNLLVLLFPKEQMNLFLEVLITVKLSAASAAFARMADRRFGGRIRSSLVLVLSVSYGLMQYTLAQGSNVMWLDGVILLPFIVLGVHKTVTGRGKSRKGRTAGALSLAVPAALSVIVNWYTGGINYLFSFVWFIYEEARAAAGKGNTGGQKAKGNGKADNGGKVRSDFLLYLAAMGTGLLLASFLFVPSVMAMRNGKGAGWNPMQYWGQISWGFRGNPFTAVRSYRIGEISDSSRVSLFCGSLALFGTAAYFLSGRISRREKAAGAGLCLFAVMSYFWEPLFCLFSLFQYSDSYWYRYGYLGSFVLLYLAAYWAGSLPARGGFRNLKQWAHIPEAGAVCILLMLISRRLWPSGGGGSTGTAVLVLLGITALVGAIWAPRRKQGASKAGRMAAAAALTMLCLAESFLQTRAMLNIYHTDTAEEYETYSARQQAQIGKLKEEDGGFYRVSQTSTRIGNKDGLTAAYLDAMAYGYASISGYTSCPENRQLEFMDRLGYREEYESFNIVNTSFLPADSLLSVKYVLSSYGIPGLVEHPEQGIYNGKAVYENPYVLPTAMILEDDAVPAYQENAQEQPQPERFDTKKEGLPSDSDPFPYLEKIYGALTGEETRLFSSVDYQMLYADGRTTWTLQIPEGQYCLYGNLPWLERTEGSLTVAEDWGYGYGGWLSQSVFYIPVPEGETQISIVFEADGALPLRDAQFYALDLGSLSRSAEKIRSKAEAVTELSVEAGRISCSVEAAQGQSLLMSIPFSEGWEVRNNGQKTEIGAFEGALIKIPLVQGENHITMQYRVPGAAAGILLSLAGLVITAAWALSGMRPDRSKAGDKKNKSKSASRKTGDPEGAGKRGYSR